MYLQGTLRRRHKEETDVWQTFSLLPARKEHKWKDWSNDTKGLHNIHTNKHLIIRERLTAQMGKHHKSVVVLRQRTSVIFIGLEKVLWQTADGPLKRNLQHAQRFSLNNTMCSFSTSFYPLSALVHGFQLFFFCCILREERWQRKSLDNYKNSLYSHIIIMQPL